jgi:signal transduction histidine kinase
MRDIHQLSWELRPSALDHLGLVVALEHFIREWATRPGPKIDFHARGFDGDRLPDHFEIALYRVVQEAITNIMKHASATQASVILERLPDKARAIIEDNGRGFDIDTVLHRGEAVGRLGLLGMQERVELVGGRLDIESTAGTGTTVFVEIPVSMAAQPPNPPGMALAAATRQSEAIL